jgi:hypothetical protein
MKAPIGGNIDNLLYGYHTFYITVKKLFHNGAGAFISGFTFATKKRKFTTTARPNTNQEEVRERMGLEEAFSLKNLIYFMRLCGKFLSFFRSWG